MLFPQAAPDGHPQTPPPCRRTFLITSPTFAKSQLVWRRLCDAVLSRSSRLFEHTLTAVRTLPAYKAGRKYQGYSFFVNDQMFLWFSTRHTCIVLKSGWS